MAAPEKTDAFGPASQARRANSTETTTSRAYQWRKKRNQMMIRGKGIPIAHIKRPRPMIFSR